MATLVSFHAHPDDEAILTGGTLAKASAAGHRVVVVFATGGERGEVPAGLRVGETLAQRRASEAATAAAALGVSDVRFLGYADSGMMGDAANDDRRTFWQADVEEAARRLASVLRAEDAEALTIYDYHGSYGHPDHIQVHRVGTRAASMAGSPTVYEATVTRDRVQ